MINLHDKAGSMYEILVGLEVIDDVRYQTYRENMTPILHQLGGDFGHDFRVSEVLKPKESSTINRVFTICFPNEDVMNRFFSDHEYLAVKAQYFEQAVGYMTIIARYEKTIELDAT